MGHSTLNCRGAPRGGRPYSAFKSMTNNRWVCLAVVVLGILVSSANGAQDVLHYAATIEPDISSKSVKGSVRIRFTTDSDQAQFDCGSLTIDAVRMAKTPLKFSVQNS